MGCARKSACFQSWKKSEWPKGVVEDLKNYDESIFFFKGKRPFVFED